MEIRIPSPFNAGTTQAGDIELEPWLNLSLELGRLRADMYIAGREAIKRATGGEG